TGGRGRLRVRARRSGVDAASLCQARQLRCRPRARLERGALGRSQHTRRRGPRRIDCVPVLTNAMGARMHARKHMMLVAFICSSCTTESNLEFTGPPPIEFTLTSRPGALDFRWGQSTGALNYRICTTAAACAAPGEPQQDTDAPILTYA